MCAVDFTVDREGTAHAVAMRNRRENRLGADATWSVRAGAGAATGLPQPGHALKRASSRLPQYAQYMSLQKVPLSFDPRIAAAGKPCLSVRSHPACVYGAADGVVGEHPYNHGPKGKQMRYRIARLRSELAIRRSAQSGRRPAG